MARQVLPIAGAVIGAYFGSPQLGYAIGSIVGNIVDPVVNQGPKLGELPTQTSNEGQPRAIIYGTATCTGYIASFSDVEKITVTTQGDKGGPETESEHALRSYNIIICEGPIQGILRVWKNDKLVYDVRPGSQMLPESEKWMENKTLYLGGEDQLPDTWLEQHVNPATPAYRGSAHLVFMDEDVTETAGAIPQYRWEVAASASVVPLPKFECESAFGLASGVNAAGPGLLSHNSYPISAGQIAPLLQITTTSPSVNPYTTPNRMMVYLGGALRFDSGWYSDLDGQQDALNDLLMLQGYPELIGPISHTWDKTQEIHVNSTVTSGSIEHYRAGVPTAESSTNQLTLDGIMPDKDEVPTNSYTYHPSVDGVGVMLDDGSLFSACWGPDFINITGEAVELGEIVADQHDRSAIPSEDYDVSELTDMVDGLTITGDYTAADVINTLRSCYFFDKAEPGDKLYYPKRGKPVVMTLDFEDLVDVPDLSKRDQMGEVPKKMHLLFQNATAGYAPIKATYERSSIDVQSVVETTMQVPVVLDVDEGQQMVHKIMKISTADAGGEIKLTLPERLIGLIPSDNVGLNLRGQVRRLRIDEMEWNDGVMSPTLRADRQSAYTSELTGIPIPEPTLPPSTIVGDTEFVYADISSRSDFEDDLNYYVAGIGPMPGWQGWALQRSLDGGANYTTVEQFRTLPVMGSLVDPITDASEFYTDTTNVVRVQLYKDNQSLESLTETQFLSEGGAFILEKPDGTFEIMQYLDAVEDSNGIFELSTLHRGLLNSGTTNHLTGARFVMLEDASHIPAQSSWIGQPLTQRGVSIGDSPENAEERTDIYVGRSQTEWPVAYLELERDGSDNVSGTWTPRHRFGTDDNPVASINFRGYQVTIDDGSISTTFETVSPSFTYDASAMADPVTVSVSSLNRITGAGPAESGVV